MAYSTPIDTCRAVFLVAEPDEDTYISEHTSYMNIHMNVVQQEQATIEYKLRLVSMHTTDLLGWFNGLWDLSRPRANTAIAASEDVEDMPEAMEYLRSTLGVLAGRWETRLDDLCTVRDGDSGIPPEPLGDIQALGEWFAAHVFCEQEIQTGPEGVTWGNTSRGFDWAFALLDTHHGEEALRLRLARFKDLLGPESVAGLVRRCVVKTVFPWVARFKVQMTMSLSVMVNDRQGACSYFIFVPVLFESQLSTGLVWLGVEFVCFCQHSGQPHAVFSGAYS